MNNMNQPINLIQWLFLITVLFIFSDCFETAVWIRGFKINGILILSIKSELFGCEQISYRWAK